MKKNPYRSSTPAVAALSEGRQKKSIVLAFQTLSVTDNYSTQERERDVVSTTTRLFSNVSLILNFYDDF